MKFLEKKRPKIMQPGDEEYHRREERKHWTIQNRLANFSNIIASMDLTLSLVAAIAAICAVIYAADTYTAARSEAKSALTAAKEAQRQADIAQQALISAGRAWLYPENFNISVSYSGEQLVFTVTGDNQNLGHEPAIDTLFSQADAEALPITGTDSRNFGIPTDDMCTHVTKWIENTTKLPFEDSVFPGQKLSYEREEAVPLSATQANNVMIGLKTGHTIYYWRDCVAYKTFGSIHTSAFCFYLMYDPVADKLTTFHCPHGNEAN